MDAFLSRVIYIVYFIYKLPLIVYFFIKNFILLFPDILKFYIYVFRHIVSGQGPLYKLSKDKYRYGFDYTDRMEMNFTNSPVFLFVYDFLDMFMGVLYNRLVKKPFKD